MIRRPERVVWHAFLAIPVAMVCIASRCTSDAPVIQATRIGADAYQLAQELIALGPRPPGSAGISNARDWIEAKVKAQGLSFARRLFQASTPIGEIEMVNLSYAIPGTRTNRRVLLMAHYDSKRFVGFDFVGANDAASSVALLLALTPTIRQRNYAFRTDVVFVDGEEAVDRWSAADSLYGSREYATTLSSGLPILAAVVVDMVGDRDLKLIRNGDVDTKLLKHLETIVVELRVPAVLASTVTRVEDDHTPLIAAGVPTLHLMDFTYGDASSPGPYWHTAEDTIDKISAESLSLVGEILLRLLDKISG